MLLHRRQDAESALQPLVIVVTDVFFNRSDKCFSVCEFSAIVAFSFEYAPESFHRTVVNALADPRHTLDHPGVCQFCVEDIAGILEATVAVEDWMSVRICRYRHVKGVKYQWIVVPVPNHIRNNAPVTEIQNRAQIQLVFLFSAVPLEFGDVGQPFLIRFFRVEVTCKNVFGEMLWALCTAGAAVVGVLHRRANILRAADPKHPFVVDLGVVVTLQVIPDPPVSFVWVFLMNLLHQLADPLILNLSGT